MSLDGTRRRCRELQSEDFLGMKRTKYDPEKESKSEFTQKTLSFLGIESLLYSNVQNNNSVNFLWKITFQKALFLKNFVANDCHNDLPREPFIWEFQLSNNKQSNTSNNSSTSMIFKLTCKKITNKNMNQEKSSKVIINPLYKTLVKYEDDESQNETEKNRNEEDLSKEIEEYLENSDFNADIELNYCNLLKKSANFKIKNLKVGTVYQKEITIPTEIYTKLIKEDHILLLFDINIVRNLSNFQVKPYSKFNYIGLINEGMTCYMNSMLQTLNVLGSFKKAVFQIPVKEDENNSKNNIVSSLQRLFYDLMIDKFPVSTNRLIKSFGWGRDEMLIQHDVQEFNQLLSDMMDKKMKGTPVEGTFAKLFEGKLLNFIECVNVDYQSKRKEKFLDLSLTVKGCKNIYDSFNKYTEVEMLDNENKYETETFGKQTARKGIKFVKFPNVLILQLKRFEYNPKKESMVKINDYFEFPETLDLSSYMCESTKNHNMFNLYTLHSIVVHKGSANSGHYYCFIRPRLEDIWFKFNDDFVKPANKNEVFNINYGGVIKQYRHKGRGEIVESNLSSEANAYILVYIKNNMREEILKPITLNDIPLSLKQKFDFEKKEEMSRIKSRQRLENNTNIILFSPEMIKGRMNMGVHQCYFDTEESYPFFINPSSRFVLNFPKNIKIKCLVEFISQQTKIPKELISLYIYEISFQNILTRYNHSLIPLKNLDFSIEEQALKVKMSIPLILFVTVKDPNYRIFQKTDIKKETILFDEKLEIFINSKLNCWNFAENSYKQVMVEKVKTQDKIIFLKYLKYENKKFDLVLDDVLQISKDYTFSQLLVNLQGKLKDRCRYYIRGLNEIDDSSYSVDFLIEKMVNILEFNKTANTEIVDPQRSIGSYDEDKESLILIVNLSFSGRNPFEIEIDKTNDLIEKILMKYLSCVFINIYNEMHSIQGISHKKYLFNLLESEDKLKQNLLNIIISDFNYIDVFYNNYYLNTRQQLIDRELFQKEINIDFLELRADKDPQILKEYPLIKYLTNPETSLFFHLYLFPKTEMNFTQTDFFLFDEDNNPIEKVCIALPKKSKTCREVADYLYEPVFKKFYKALVKEELYFILQNPSQRVIYEVFRYGSDDLFQHIGKEYLIEYRIQPFKRMLSYEFVDFFGAYKIFFSFLSKDGICIEYPFFIFISKEISIKIFYEIIIERIKAIKYIYMEENSIKIYKSKITDNVEKKYVLSNRNSEESILTFFKEKNNFFNVVIELPIIINLNNNNNQILK